jgi:hypothetical protein
MTEQVRSRFYPDGVTTMTTVLYGECVGSRETATVRICDLADMGCDLEPDGAHTVTDGEVSLWIGAVGPFHGVASRRDARRHAIRFKEPLDGRILQHFRG